MAQLPDARAFGVRVEVLEKRVRLIGCRKGPGLACRLEFPSIPKSLLGPRAPQNGAGEGVDPLFERAHSARGERVAV
jgi:hypothetical protein